MYVYSVQNSNAFSFHSLHLLLLYLNETDGLIGIDVIWHYFIIC